MREENETMKKINTIILLLSIICLNVSADVDFDDLKWFNLHWLGSDCNYPSYCDGADIDGSGEVNFYDFAIFSMQWFGERTWDTGLQVTDITSNFDSGNLINIALVDTNSFTAEINTTYNPTYYPFWYFFKVENGLNKTLILDITNMIYWRSYWYISTDLISWTRSASKTISNGAGGEIITHTGTDNTYYIARSPVISYTAMQIYLNSISVNDYVTLDAGLSTQSRNVSCVTITDPCTPEAGKIKIVLFSGQHGGERNAQYLVYKILQFLVSDDLTAQEIRQKAIFKVFPQVNPDGIFHGILRHNVNSKDLNREWDDIEEDTEAEILYARTIIDNFNPDYSLDFHGEWVDDLFKQPSSAVGVPVETASIELLNSIKIGTHWNDVAVTNTTAPPRCFDWFVNSIGYPAGTIEMGMGTSIATFDSDAEQICNNFLSIINE